MGCITTLSSGRFYSVKKNCIWSYQTFLWYQEHKHARLWQKGILCTGSDGLLLAMKVARPSQIQLLYIFEKQKNPTLTVELIAEDIEVAFYYFLSSVSFYLPMQKGERNKHCHNCVQKLMTSRMFLLLASHFGQQWFKVGPQKMVRMLYVYHIWEISVLVPPAPLRRNWSTLNASSVY